MLLFDLGYYRAIRFEQIELLFREFEGSYRLGQMPSADRHVTKTLIYAAPLTLLVIRRLYRALRARWRLDPRRLPFDRWAVLVATVADDLLDIALNRHDRDWRASRVERFLRREAVDPNAARIPLPYRAQSGVHPRAQPITIEHPFYEVPPSAATQSVHPGCEAGQLGQHCVGQHASIGRTAIASARVVTARRAHDEQQHPDVLASMRHARRW